MSRLATARSLVVLLVWAGWLHAGDTAPRRPRETWLSPAAVTAAPDGKGLYIACATAGAVLQLDQATGSIAHQFELPGNPSGLQLSADGTRLYVTCGTEPSAICELDAARGTILATLPAGHSARSPVLAPDGKTLYSCDRFDNCVVAYELPLRAEKARIPVRRQPISLAVSADGRVLLVAHHLPGGRADSGFVAASVSVVDTATNRVVKHLDLPSGSSLVREIKIAPDGRLAAVTHNLARYQMPTTQADRGWINTSALTLIDVPARSIFGTVLLDDVDRGAANPWAVAWSHDGKKLVVSHAGTHELSLIDVTALLAKLRGLPARLGPSRSGKPSAMQATADGPSDLSFLVGVRQRIPLPGRGPRALALAGSRLYVANYFSDTVDVLDLNSTPPQPRPIPLRPPGPVSPVRRGEMFFNDATLSFQGWQSCASCHSDDGRVDGLDWDLLNDGIGNPKNTRSLVWAHRTPPAMSTAVRETAGTAVRSGLAHILFAVADEGIASAIDRYLESLEPLPSPKLENGRPSAAAKRGEVVFRSPETGCTFCHAGLLSTDLKRHDVGTVGPFDQGQGAFDTPALLELWRTAPYLHDGSCSSLHELVTRRNPADQHGMTSHLSRRQIDDLVDYLLSR